VLGCFGFLLLVALGVLVAIWPAWRAQRHPTGAARQAHRELVLAAAGVTEAEGQAAWERLAVAAGRFGRVEEEVNRQLQERGELAGVTYGEWLQTEPAASAGVIRFREPHAPDEIMFHPDVEWREVLRCPDVREHPATALLMESARAQGLLDLLPELATAQLGVQPQPEPEDLLISGLLELPAGLAQMPLALVAVARVAVADGDLQQGTLAMRAALRVARTLACQGSLIEHFAGGEIRDGAGEALRRELDLGHLDADACAAMLRVLGNEALPPITHAFAGERQVVYDVMEWAYTDDGDGDGMLIPPGLDGPSNPDPDLLECIIARCFVASRAESRAWFDARMDELQVLADTPLADHKVTGCLGRWTWKFDEAYALADVRSSLPWRELQVPVSRAERPYVQLLFVLGPMHLALRRDATNRLWHEATRLRLALEVYRGAHGEYPASLEALVPATVLELPADPVGGDPFVYRLDPATGSYLLYSTGYDGEDDGGDFEPCLDDEGRLLPPRDLPLHRPQ
jgi:hypothetical protein